jgi:hypothetical protein
MSCLGPAFDVSFTLLGVDESYMVKESFGPFGRLIHPIVMKCGKDVGSCEIAKVFIDKRVWNAMVPFVQKLTRESVVVDREIRYAQTQMLMESFPVMDYGHFRDCMSLVNSEVWVRDFGKAPGNMLCVPPVSIFSRLGYIARHVVWEYESFYKFFFGILRRYVYGLNGRGCLLVGNDSLRALALASIIDACGGGKEWLSPSKVALLGLPAAVSEEIVDQQFRPCAFYTNSSVLHCFVD